MGQSPSSPFLARGGSNADDRSPKLKERLQVLEDLVQGTTWQRRQEQLRESAADRAGQPTRYSILPRAPEEFNLGSLIAAGSYGRVYAGSYRGQPAAIKVLILEEESAAAILNEVRLCLKLNHRNLVRLLDCAVVGTSVRQSPGSRSTLDGWWYSSEQKGYNYLPMMAGEQQHASIAASPAGSRSNIQQPSMEVARTSSLEDPRISVGNDMLSQDCRPGLGLLSASGHACYEVWIAMELCDGGTLAEQVRRGFQYCPGSRQVDMELLLTVALDIARALLYMHAEDVCHGDLKAENVLLRSLHDDDMGASWKDSSSECSWLQKLCHNTNSSSFLSCGRRASRDSCWSFANSTSQKGSTAPSSSSSSSTGVLASGRQDSVKGKCQRSGGLLLLTNLCRAGAAATCVDKENADDSVGSDQNAHDCSVSARCFSCGGMPTTLTDTGQQQQDANNSESSVVNCSIDVAAHGQLPHQGMAGPAALLAPAVIGNGATAAADGEPFSVLTAQILGSGAHRQNTSFGGARQPAVQNELSRPQPHAADEVAEDEHIAPLSLYSPTREQRRMRRLSNTGLMPSVHAALAAANAAGLSDATSTSGKLPINSSGDSSRDTNNQLASDKEIAVTNGSAASASSAGSQQQQKQQKGSWSAYTAVGSAGEQRLSAPVRTVQRQELPGLNSRAEDQVTRASSSPAFDKVCGGAAAAVNSSLAAHSQRSRRHNHGSRIVGYSAMGLSGASSYAPPTSQLRQQYTCSDAVVSAAEAAAAIAAAADAAKAARDDSQLARRTGLVMSCADELLASGSRRHRSRRMSCDDRLLQHMSNATAYAAASSSSPCSGGRSVIGQGRLPLALRRTGRCGLESAVAPVLDGAAAIVGPAASKRRHSWASVYFKGAADFTPGAQCLRGIANMMPSKQRQPQQCARRVPLEVGQPSAQLTCPLLLKNSNSLAAAEDSKQHWQSWQQQDGAPSGRGRRRRHSWAGYFAAQQPLTAGGGGTDLATGTLSCGQWLSACCSPSDMAVLECMPELQPATGLQTLGRFSLASFVGCCGSATGFPLLGDSFNTDVGARQSLLSDFQPSNQDCPVDSPAAGATDICGMRRFGQRSSSSKSSRSRQRSWCCGTFGTDVSAVLSGVQSGSSSCAELLGPVQLALKAPETRLGRPVGFSSLGKARRQSSWDSNRYRALHDAAAAEAPSAVAVGSLVALSLMSSKQLMIGRPSAVPKSSTTQQQSSSLCTSEGDAAVSALLARPSKSLAPEQPAAQHQQQPTNSDVANSQHISTGLQQGSTHSGTGTAEPVVAVGRQSAVSDSSAVAQQPVRVGTGELLGVLVPIRSACNSLSPLPASPASLQQLQLQQAGSTSALGLDRDLPVDLFIGSFDFNKTDGSRHCSRHSSMGNTVDALDSIKDPLAQKQQQYVEKSASMEAGGRPSAAISSGQLSNNIALSTSSGRNGAAVSSSSVGSSGDRRRRWSTGVPAHDLLKQQQGLLASGVKGRRTSACIPSPIRDVLDAAPSSSCARANHSLSHELSPVMSSSLATGRRHEDNVLGMPQISTSVLAQRRLSYDTATGTYTMIDQAALAGASSRRPNPDIKHLQKVVHSQQPNQQQQSQHSQDAQQDQQQKEISQQQQVDMQQRMQRLLEALAKRGYAGIKLDNRSASPAQQQQQIGTMVAPAASVPVPSAAASAGSAARSPSPHCVPPAYSRPKYCAKVCDFGFSQCLGAGQSHHSTLVAGTITHQAPEVLQRGFLSPAADIYAFGIILWELLTGERPFRGLLEGDLVGGVCEQGLRPQFPPGAPEAYVALAQQCWAESVADRPTAQQLLKRLNEMLYEVRRHKQLDMTAVQRGASGGNTPSSRPRRHSMPAVRASGKRRVSRCLSQLLLFGRQPVTIPEYTPLKPISTAAGASGNLVCDSHLTAGRRGSRTQTPVPHGDPAHMKLALSVPTPAAGGGAPSATAIAAVGAGMTPVGAPASTEEGGTEWFQSFD